MLYHLVHILRLMQSAATFLMFLHFISMSHSSRHQQCNGYQPYMDLMQRLTVIFFSECDLNAGHGLVMEWDAKLIQSSFIRTVSRRAQSSANVCGALTIYRDIWGGRFPCTIHFGGVYFQFLFLFFFFFWWGLAMGEIMDWPFISGCRRLKTHTPAHGR